MRSRWEPACCSLPSSRPPRRRARGGARTRGGRPRDLRPGGIVVGCRLRLERRPAQVVQKALQYRLKVWKESQPFALATAGYLWKEPPGDRAARLVEMVGLRGKRVNGAEIPLKSANLIINRGGAT